MDAKQLGTFIADRRKELGMTQNLLAEKLHVTDKAVSRWERGVGLPDINIFETLAQALEVSLVELMQAQRSGKENISTKEAEQLLTETIRLSKSGDRFIKILGTVIICSFAVISALMLALLVSDKGLLFSAVSIITGLIAWGIPVWQISFAKNGKSALSAVTSFGFALLSVTVQFMDIANEVHTGDWWAVEDTIDALVIVVLLFGSITLLLNIIAAKVSKIKNEGNH